MTPEQCKAWVLERYPDTTIIRPHGDVFYHVAVVGVGDFLHRSEGEAWVEAYLGIEQHMLHDARVIRSEIARLGTPDNPRFRVLWMNTLHDIAERRPGIPTNKLGQPVVSDFDKWVATDEEIVAAWEKVKGKI